MFGVYKTYEEFVAAAEEAAKRGELWFCPNCFNTNPVMKFCGSYGMKAHYVYCLLHAGARSVNLPWH